MNHVPVELMNIMEGIHTTHVPYKGTVPSLGAVVSGKMHFQFSNLIASSALGTRGTRRLPAMPDLPVIAEAGMPGFQASALFGLFMPEATPRDISACTAMSPALNAKDMQQMLSADRRRDRRRYTRTVRRVRESRRREVGQGGGVRKDKSRLGSKIHLNRILIIQAHRNSAARALL